MLSFNPPKGINEGQPCPFFDRSARWLQCFNPPKGINEGQPMLRRIPLLMVAIWFQSPEGD